MYIKQHTLKEEIELEGVGLHTGNKSKVRIKPAPDNYGIKFVRVDLPEKPVIEADIDNVVEYERSTTLGKGGVKIYTVEHLMSALSGLQIDNAIIEIEGNEPPAMDGSSIEYVKAIKKVGTQEQQANREFYVIEEPIHYRDDEKEVDLAAMPFDGFRVTVIVDYNSPVLSVQHATLVDMKDYETEIAPARTFCFIDEVLPLFKKGLIKGGSLDNSVVLVDRELSEEEISELKAVVGDMDVALQKGVLNQSGLRFPNEPARHKLLDLIGDFSLLGTPLKAQIMAVKIGRAHV